MVDPLASQGVRLDEIDQAAQQNGAVTDIVGERRHAEAHAFSRIGLALTVQWLMQAKLVEQDHRQQIRARGSAWNGMEWRWRLRDRLAGLADEFLTDRLHDDPLAGNDLAAFGDRFTDLLEISALAARTVLWRRYDHPTTREVVR